MTFVSPIHYFNNNVLPSLPELSAPQLVLPPLFDAAGYYPQSQSYDTSALMPQIMPFEMNYSLEQTIQDLMPPVELSMPNPMPFNSNMQLNYQNFNVPELNTNLDTEFLSLTRPKAKKVYDTPKTDKTDKSYYAPKGKKDLSYWKSLGYDEEKGAKLAKDAVARCPFVWDHNCVGYTRETINAVYGTKFEKAGPGYNFGHHILDSKELKGKFKCIKINGIRSEDIPDGAILIWPKTAFGKGKAAQYGHGAIAYHGKPYSDNVGCNTMKCNEIWIPVKDEA